MDKCSKCFAEQPHMEGRIEGGVCYKFCSLCSQVLEGSQDTHQVFKFLQKDHGNANMSEEAKRMIEARILRAEGNSPWKTEDLDF